MKTFVQTIVVLVILNLATACSALAQDVSEREEIEAAMQYEETAERLEEAIEEAVEETIEEAVERQTVKIAVPQVRIRSTGRPHPFAERYGGSGPVFVIPTSEMKAEDLVTIMEDMRVMSRIFDKKLGLSPAGIFPGTGFDFSFFGPHSARSTEAIFLQGYGALFLMKVDFPLSPPTKEEEEAEEEPKEHIDELWKETRQEIYEPADAGRRRTDEEEEEYDEEKVEEMKETLIKALKHATNIRNLKADESVILTVAGSGDSSNITSVAITGSNQIFVKDKDKKMKIVTPTSLSDLGASSPTVMTIRVKKSDVDAFAKGKLDFDKFRQKVQIFTY